MAAAVFVLIGDVEPVLCFFAVLLFGVFFNQAAGDDAAPRVAEFFIACLLPELFEFAQENGSLGRRGAVLGGAAAGAVVGGLLGNDGQSAIIGAVAGGLAGNAYAYHNKKMNQKDGDIAWRDEDGYFWYVGRADDVIKSSGYRIGPFEVESALMTHPAVVECAITGVPDEIRGQVVKATIVLAREYRDRAGDELIHEIQDHVKRVTAPYKYPRIVEFVDALPKTISGKIRRVEIREKDGGRG